VTTQLGDLLDEARRRTFVGRRRELASFDDALEGRSSRRVLLVHGPGGIGKTTLLLELRTRGRDAGRAVVLLDAREIDPSPEGFEHAVLAALGEPPGGPVAGRLAGALTAGLNLYRAILPPASLLGSPLELPPVQAPAMGIWSSGDLALTEEQMTGSAKHVTGP
jgi:AAA ATPase domain